MDILNASGSTPNRAHYFRCLGFLGLAYVLIYGWLLATSNFLPYVMDNNESFSSLWHAINLYHFDFWKSFGLTDEAYGYSAAAHPYVYTHQGNFPRLFAFLIYALGARTIEAQIFVTTFTVGLLAVYFAFHFFEKITTPIFALLTCLVLITDYVLIAQWQVVTYRVWHGFFIFSTLLCVHGISNRTKIWPILAILNSAALFYFELVFVAFVSLAAAFYAAALYWSSPRLVAKSWGLQAVGAVLGLGILATQLILYLGWDDFLHDAYLTFTARNQFSDPGLLAQIQDFFERHNVVFWYNLEDGSRFRALGYLVSSVTYYELQIHTPFFTVLTWIPILALVLAVLWYSCERQVLRMHAPASEADGTALRRGAMIFSVLASLFLFFLVVLNAKYFLGISPEQRWFSPPSVGTGIAALGLAAICYVLIANFTGHVRGAGLRLSPPHSADRMLKRLSAFLITATILIGGSWKLFYQKYGLLWEEILSNTLPDPASRILLICTVGVSSLFVVLEPTSRLVRTALGQLRPLSRFLIAGLVAYIIVFIVSPGYIFSGYRFRIFPFTRFHDVVLMSGGLYLLGSAAAYCLSSPAIRSTRLPSFPKSFSTVREEGSGAEGRVAAFTMLATGVLASIVVVVCGYFWLGMQMTYMRLFPHDYYSFLTKLAAPPFKDAPFITNTYAAPLAAFTGKWAYLHDGLTRRTLPSKDGVLRITADYTYMWFADKRTNPEYERPEYFMCIIVQSMPSLLAKLQRDRGQGPGHSGCATDPLVELATGKSNQRISPSVSLAEIDTEGPKTVGFERWAIVKLNWGDSGEPGDVPAR